MAKYRVTWQEIQDVTVELEANSEDEAYDAARAGDVEPQTSLSELVPDSLRIENLSDEKAA